MIRSGTHRAAPCTGAADWVQRLKGNENNMNRRHLRWGFALALGPLAACASSPPPAPPAPPPPPPLAANDASFVTTMAQSNLGEIAEAHLALQQSKSAKIQNYAQTMITDHQKLQDQLTQIAQSHNATVPTDPGEAAQAQLTALQAMHGYRFDHAYVQDQITDHQMALQAAQDEAQNGTDPALKQYAQAGAPIIQSHIQMAQQLAAPMGHHRFSRHKHRPTTS